LPANQQT